jgi:hypothetical protein
MYCMECNNTLSEFFILHIPCVTHIYFCKALRLTTHMIITHPIITQVMSPSYLRTRLYNPTKYAKNVTLQDER